MKLLGTAFAVAAAASLLLIADHPAPIVIAMAVGFASFALIAFDVAYLRSYGTEANGGALIGRWLLAAGFTFGAGLVVAGLRNEDFFIPAFFCGLIVIFGLVFRFGATRPRLNEEDRIETTFRDAVVSGGRRLRIEEFAARGRISPFPGIALVLVGLLLMSTAAIGVSVAAGIGVMAVLAGGGLLVARRRSMPFGVSYVTPSEAPMRLANGIGGRITTPKPLAETPVATLSCVQRRLTSGGPTGKALSISLETLWETSAPLENGAFFFTPPENLPGVKRETLEQVAWTLTASAPGYRAVFRLPVM